MGRRDRSRRPARRPPSQLRDPKPVILIVCEGEVTEPQYLRGFVSACKNPRVRIRVAEQQGVPLTLVKVAKRLKQEQEQVARREADDNAAFDEVWCVFDVDEHPHIAQAIAMARDNGISLAISNPNFELWLVLHFAEPPGARQRHEVRSLLREHVPGYNKHVDFKLFEPGYEAALRRAKRLDEEAPAENDEIRNPSTGVYRLTRSIARDSAFRDV